MALNVKVFDPPIEQIGNVAVIGSDNQPFKTNIFTSFNYLINDNDYFAGTLQFITIAEILLSLNNAARWIQFRDSNPIEYDLGDYSLNTGTGLFGRGKISSLSQTIISSSRIISLDRNEAARPKLIRLTSRPRLLMSKSANEGMDISGAVRPGLFSLNFAGALAGTAAGAITGTGTGVGTIAPNAQVVYPRRSFITDSTDGKLDFTYAPFSESQNFSAQYNSLGDKMQIRNIGIFLRPGITGTLKLTVYKAGETDSILTNPNSTYVSTVLPAI